MDANNNFSTNIKIIEECKSILKYSKENYEFIIKLMEINDKNYIILIVKKENINNYVYETIIEWQNFQKLQKKYKLLRLCDDFKQTYNFIKSSAIENRFSIKTLSSTNLVLIRYSLENFGFEEYPFFEFNLIKSNHSINDVLYIINKNVINLIKNENKLLSDTDTPIAIKITSMGQLKKMTENNTKKLTTITFHKMEINEEFIEIFWKLFSKGIDNLEFDQCILLEDYKYSNLLDGDYQVKYLKIIGNNLTLDDIDSIFSLLYPYTIRKITLIGEGLDNKAISEIAFERLGSFASNVIECINTSV